jgi:hypothetical protein
VCLSRRPCAAQRLTLLQPRHTAYGGGPPPPRPPRRGGGARGHMHAPTERACVLACICCARVQAPLAQPPPQARQRRLLVRSCGRPALLAWWLQGPPLRQTSACACPVSASAARGDRLASQRCSCGCGPAGLLACRTGHAACAHSPTHMCACRVAAQALAARRAKGPAASAPWAATALARAQRTACRALLARPASRAPQTRASAAPSLSSALQQARSRPQMPCQRQSAGACRAMEVSVRACACVRVCK